MVDSEFCPYNYKNLRISNAETLRFIPDQRIGKKCIKNWLESCRW